MNSELLQKYAQLIVKVGANVQKGQKVRLTTEVDQAPLAVAITEECYKAGAAHVEVLWQCGKVKKLDYQYASTEVLGTVEKWEEEKGRQMVEDLPVRIFIESADPDVLNGISPDVISTVTKMRSSVMKKFRDQIDGKHQWVIAAAASPAWAKKVFPGVEEAEAVEKLWDAILSCVYLSEDADPEAIWTAHTEKMTEKANWLNEQQFTELRYKSSNGTDFSVQLIPGAKWSGARDFNHDNKVYYVPNLPTEEVFNSPMRGKCEGRLVSTKALSWSGQLIDEFIVDFKDGKVVDCQAKVGEETLKKMFAIDEGSSMLGEVALVPKESPINQSGLMFYNTLFDENACCHVAVGGGFGEVIEGYIDMTKEELFEKGINDSLIHVDFMVGSDDLDIVGIKEDGTEVPVFVNGTWA
ncbi:MAG: aminopeptidase [Eubacteriales bacterium]|nr:aminopeptidase [Eubacteriales bacterium]